MDIQKGTYTYTGSGGKKRHVPIERVHSFSQLHKGDHIAIKRLYGFYWHHALVDYVWANGSAIIVIEYSSNEFSQDVGDLRSPGKAKVMTGNYRLEGDWYVIKHPDDTCLPADEVVARAKSKLGESGYRLFKKNCEHFVMWCKTEISSSEQVKNIEEMAKKAANEIGPPFFAVGGFLTGRLVRRLYEQR